MGALNTPGEVWQQLLALLVILGVFFWIYANMEENSFKKSIRDFIGRMKGGE